MSDDEITEDTRQLSDSDSDEDDSGEEPIESLVAGRERRKTAGNRYDRETVLEEAPAEDEPDEVALLFADNEDEEDEEFKSDEPEDDADMSSSDDDDQGPNAATEDLEGEQELQKQAKEERSKKRKADLALTSVAGLRKKLKTDPTRPSLPSAKPKPSKKKERVTWVHAPDSGRSSLRKQTIAHRAETIQRLKESEAQSKKLKALKEKRERERAEDAPKELTQADRLAEAARVERQNAKSLNRWEAMEKKRQEEQAAKLAALKNRKLEGPVVSWWSAKAKWIGPRLKMIGTRDAGDLLEGGGGGPPKKKPGRKTKAELERLAAEKNAELIKSGTAQTSTESIPSTAPAQPGSETNLEQTEQTPSVQTTTPTGAETETIPGVSEKASSIPLTVTGTEANPHIDTPQSNPPQEKATTMRQPEAEAHSDPAAAGPSPVKDSFLEGIHEYANMQEDGNTPASGHDTPQQQRDASQPPEQKSDVPMPDVQVKERIAEPRQAADDMSQGTPNIASPASPNSKLLSDAHALPVPPEPQSEDLNQVPLQNDQPQVRQPLVKELPDKDIIKTETSDSQGLPDVKPDVPVPEPVIEYSTRNLLVLEKFDELPSQARQEYSLFFNQRKPGRASAKSLKHSQELCPITTLPVRYRDPDTGIAYANAAAYKKLQELKNYEFAWSSMLGCYVGRNGGIAARGVPEGFIEQ